MHLTNITSCEHIFGNILRNNKMYYDVLNSRMLLFCYPHLFGFCSFVHEENESK